MKIFLTIIGGIVVLSLITAGIFYIIGHDAAITEAPPPTTPASGQPAPVEEPTSPSPDEAPIEPGIDGLNNAIAEVITTGEPREVVIVITETEANNKATELLPTIEIPADIPLEIESIHLDLQPDNIVLVESQGTLSGRLKTTIRATTQVSIVESKPRVEITRISFSFVPVPQALKDKMVSLITEKLDDFVAQLITAGNSDGGEVSLVFRDISIREDDLTVTAVIAYTPPPTP
ncbi:MAG TPA: DUF3597 domain-containing protein [Dehalococcoidia bacterium]|nr:DUF3597 domain-containing protein [Dehalococcoidia bacterium]